MLEKARDIYEEGLNTVTTVRDFSLIFDTLTHFEESLITYKMQQAADEAEVPEDDDSDGDNFVLKDNVSDLDLRCAVLCAGHMWACGWLGLLHGQQRQKRQQWGSTSP